MNKLKLIQDQIARREASLAHWRAEIKRLSGEQKSLQDQLPGFHDVEIKLGGALGTALRGIRRGAAAPTRSARRAAPPSAARLQAQLDDVTRDLRRAQAEETRLASELEELRNQERRLIGKPKKVSAEEAAFAARAEDRARVAGENLANLIAQRDELVANVAALEAAAAKGPAGIMAFERRDPAFASLMTQGGTVRATDARRRQVVAGVLSQRAAQLDKLATEIAEAEAALSKLRRVSNATAEVDPLLALRQRIEVTAGDLAAVRTRIAGSPGARGLRNGGLRSRRDKILDQQAALARADEAAAARATNATARAEAAGARDRLAGLSVVRLRQLANDAGIVGRARMTKLELVAALAARP